jgi:hypothetical protein
MLAGILLAIEQRRQFGTRHYNSDIIGSEFMAILLKTLGTGTAFD